MSESLNFSFRASQEPVQPQLEGVDWQQMVDKDSFEEFMDDLEKLGSNKTAGFALLAIMEHQQQHPLDRPIEPALPWQDESA